MAVTRAVAAARPDVPIVWGGWHPSMFATECLAEPGVTATVQAQGEVTFTSLVERLAEGAPIDDVAGSTSRVDGVVRRRPPRPLTDLNELRPHNYELLDPEPYFALKGKRQLDYISSQGCYFRCAFCADPFVYERKWTALAPERMGDEIEHWWRRWGFDDVNFQDETFFTRPERVRDIAEQFLRRGLRVSWAGTMRADQGARLDDETFALCKRSGLRRVLVGVESGSPEMIERIQKDIKLEQVFETAEKCRRHDIAVIFPFIVGFPGETMAQAQASLDVAERLRAMSPTFRIEIFQFLPYPGTSLTAEAVADGYRLPATLEGWSEFDYVDGRGPWVDQALAERVESFRLGAEVGRSDGNSRASSSGSKTPGWAAPSRAPGWVADPVPAAPVGTLRLEQVGGLPVVVLPEVFNPAVFRSSDLLMAEIDTLALGVAHPRVLDLGCGTGLQGLAAARRGWDVVACDINPEAVRCTRINALLNRVEERVEARCGDLFEPVANDRFDLVLFNPPFFRGTPAGGRDHAWRAVDVPERFTAELASHLNPGGVLLLVHSSDGDPAAFVQGLRRHGFTVAAARARDLANEVMTVYRAEVAG